MFLLSVASFTLTEDGVALASRFGDAETLSATLSIRGQL
jgi:hypothetical protein